MTRWGALYTVIDEHVLAALVFIVSPLLVWAAIKYTAGIRVDAEHEYEGVDLSECGMEAYPEFTTAD